MYNRKLCLFANVGVYKWLIYRNCNAILWRKTPCSKRFSLNGVSLVLIDQCNGEAFADGDQIMLKDKSL